MFIYPAIVNCLVHSYVIIHVCDSMWSFLSGSESVQVLYHLIICVLPLEIQLSRGEGWDPIYWFNPAHFLCLSQTRFGLWCLMPLSGPRLPMSHVLVFFVFSEFSQDEGWFFVLLILVELMTITVKISFHNLHNYINSCEKRVSKCMNHIHYFFSVTKLKVISLWIYDLYIS